MAHSPVIDDGATARGHRHGNDSAQEMMCAFTLRRRLGTPVGLELLQHFPQYLTGRRLGDGVDKLDWHATRRVVWGSSDMEEAGERLQALGFSRSACERALAMAGDVTDATRDAAATEYLLLSLRQMYAVDGDAAPQPKGSKAELSFAPPASYRPAAAAEPAAAPEPFNPFSPEVLRSEAAAAEREAEAAM